MKVVCLFSFGSGNSCWTTLIFRLCEMRKEGEEKIRKFKRSKANYLEIVVLISHWPELVTGLSLASESLDSDSAF